jgi:hypothetical protein
MTGIPRSIIPVDNHWAGTRICSYSILLSSDGALKFSPDRVVDALNKRCGLRDHLASHDWIMCTLRPTIIGHDYF